MVKGKVKSNQSETHKSFFATEVQTSPKKHDSPNGGALGKSLANESLEKSQLNYPLISCIMPTANRYRFVFESINSFLRQDYPNKELIIVFDQPSDLPAIKFPPNVKLIHIKNRILGAKRHEAYRHASGIITNY